MKSPHEAGIDYIHVDPYLDPTSISECYWIGVFPTRTVQDEPCFLWCRREHYDRISEIPHRHHDFWALYIVRSGRGTRVVNGHTHSMARGDIFLMSPGTMHYYRASQSLTIDAFYFHHDLWSDLEWAALAQLPELAPFLSDGEEGFAARGHTDHFGHLSPELHARVEDSIGAMRDAIHKKSLPHHFTARSLLYALLVQLADWRAEHAFSTQPSRGAPIAEVLAFCDENFQRPLSNDQLAELMHFSRSHFCEVFAREVGMPPAAYLRHLRLQHAQKLLKKPDHSVNDIARLSGFSDTTQFGRAFKKAFGVSPLAFRQQRGGQK